MGYRTQDGQGEVKEYAAQAAAIHNRSVKIVSPQPGGPHSKAWRNTTRDFTRDFISPPLLSIIRTNVRPVNWTYFCYTTSMKIIVGLGNPGQQYSHNRHNVGFLAIDFLLKDIGSSNCQSKFKAQICEVHFGSQKTFFIKPQTFMNNSGETVKEIAQFYKLDPSTDILVLHDEVDLPFGTIRSTASASSAGQNGVQNIIDVLGTQDFHRIRIGVETRESRAEMDTRDFVLQNFTNVELEKLTKEIFPAIALQVKKFIEK